MLETALVAFATFFATLGPQDVAVVFATLTAQNSTAEKRRIALRASLIGGALLLVFALAGEPLLAYLGISLAAMRAAGGILLLLIAIDMVFARDSGGTSATPEEQAEAEARDDISVFPLATPLIAGPGAIGAAILLTAEAQGNWTEIAVVIAAMLLVVILAFVLMLMAGQVQKYLGVTGVHVLSRVFGILLAALAVQFLFDGIKESQLFG